MKGESKGNWQERGGGETELTFCSSTKKKRGTRTLEKPFYTIGKGKKKWFFRQREGGRQFLLKD